MSKKYINGYAFALFDLAQEQQQLEKFKKDSQTIISALEANEQYLKLLKTKLISFAIKEQLINKAFVSVNIFVRNFLLVVAKKAIATIIIPTLNKLIKYINDDLNIKEGCIYSVKKLSRAEIISIESRVKKILGFKTTLQNKLDATLMSGMRIVVGDQVIENSVIWRLHQIKNQLLKEEN